MLDFIPISSYMLIYYNILLLIVLLTVFIYYQKQNFNQIDTVIQRTAGFLVLIFLIIYMGGRPISFIFGDMVTYSHQFEKYKLGWQSNLHSDILFDNFSYFFAKLISKESYFLLISAIYIVCHYFASKLLFKKFWYVGFLMFVTAFSFWSYGTNGLRNGLGTSTFILGLCAFKKSKWLGFLIMFSSIGFHKSMMLPFGAVVLANFISNTKLYLRAWIMAIPVSLVAGSTFERIFAGIGFGGAGDRMAGYLTNHDIIGAEGGTTMSFRWDFLLYSATGVFAGWYFIFKKKYEDTYYNTLFNVYLIANAFWILVIRAQFSNRFAYLSWFILPVVILYPILQAYIVKEQPKLVAKILLANFAFTYFMIVILGK